MFAYLHRCAWELQALEAVKNQSAAVEKPTVQTTTDWEVVIDKKSFRVWRRPIEGSHLFEYRGQRNGPENKGN